jgi:hypothetical protein
MKLEMDTGMYPQFLAQQARFHAELQKHFSMSLAQARVAVPVWKIRTFVNVGWATRSSYAAQKSSR